MFPSQPPGASNKSDDTREGGEGVPRECESSGDECWLLPPWSNPSFRKNMALFLPRSFTVGCWIFMVATTFFKSNIFVPPFPERWDVL